MRQEVSSLAVPNQSSEAAALRTGATGPRLQPMRRCARQMRSVRRWQHRQDGSQGTNEAMGDQAGLCSGSSAPSAFAATLESCAAIS